MDVSESVGIGLWQLPVVLVSLYRGIPSAMLMMNYNFAASKTAFWCRNDTDDERNIVNGVVTNCDSWYFDHSVFSWTLVEEWNLVCERSWLRPLSQSLYLTGMLFGNLIFSHVSDRFGRKVSVLLSSAMMLIFGFLGAFSSSLAMFNATRFLASLGTGGIQSTSVTLSATALPFELRVLLSRSIGDEALLLAVRYLHFVQTWRLQLTIKIIEAYGNFAYRFVPESPRWLLTRGRGESAMKEIRRAAKINKYLPPDLPQISKMFRHQGTGTRPKALTLFDLIKGPKLRIYTFVLWYTFFAQRILYFHLSFAAALIGGNVFLNYAIVQLMELPGKFLGILATIFFPRKICLISFFFSAAIAFLLALAFSGDSIWGMVAICAVSMLFVSANLELLCVYSAEVFPTSVRTMGVGSAYMASRVGSALAPFVAGI
ncbi:unnamed protein product, partial [Ixodes hexagonus]